MSCPPNFIFSVDGHDFTIVEADGTLTQPLVVDTIQIFTGTFLPSHRHTLLQSALEFKTIIGTACRNNDDERTQRRGRSAFVQGDRTRWDWAIAQGIQNKIATSYIP